MNDPRTGLALLSAECLLLAGVFAGCGTARSSFYPAFSEQKKQLGSVGLLMDYVVIEGLMGDTSKIDLIDNREVGGALLADCADSLSVKGYFIRKAILGSIGLLMQRQKGYKVARSRAAQSGGSEELTVEYPPFYVHDQFLQDTIVRHLISVYTSLINLPERRQGISFIIPEASSIGKQLDCETIMVLLVGGFNVPVSKGVGQPTFNGSQTGGIIGMVARSQLSVLFFVIDARKGEVIWDNRKFESGGVLYRAKIVGAARDLIAELP